MLDVKLSDNVFFVGALDWDRKSFDELVPLPDGTTYNSYFIKGSENNALLDTVDPSKTKVLIDNLKALNIDKIDYVVAHHAEQDHSGSLLKILELYPMAKVVTNLKCKDLLKEHVLIPEDKIIVINDRDKLSLGDKTLEFILAPWVHWPETMFTYLYEDRILFTCDFLGTHLASSELIAGGEAKVYDENKRYYAEIMMPFRVSIKGHLEKIKGLEIKMVCPSHGPILGKPQFIIDAYKEWISDNVKNEVVLPYVSMHGSTAAMANYLVDELMKRNISVRLFDLPKSDIGEIAVALVDSATIILGTSTILAGPHPLAANAAFFANMLRPKTRYAGIIGSFGWGGKTVEQVKGALPNLKAEFFEPVIVKGYPKEADFKALENLAEQIKIKHQNDPLVIK
ncbi:FprA family A-type flavoprotein [Candidatus Saganbacteria bacterium]|nr:FprA family A-type flavoprotein [Candidatus Saganbacteria bacterium]